jgi:hypothetical protein
MATMTSKEKAVEKPLRIREEYLPDSARYAIVDEEEYVMIPVKDFAGWYEDLEDRIIVEERRLFDDGPVVSLEEINAEIARDKAARS